MALLRYWPVALQASALIAMGYLVWLAAGWRDKAARVDAAEIAAKSAQQALEAERADRARVDLARLAASSKFSVTVEQVEEKTTILYRQRDRLIPVDRPCLPVEAVEALNEGK
jgi:hypothetical protein